MKVYNVGKIWKKILPIALLCSIFWVFLGMNAQRVPKKVTIDGVNVSRMPYHKAEALLRGNIVEKLQERELKIISPDGNYTFGYPEIGEEDNLRELVRSAQKGQNLTSRVRYFLNGEADVIRGIYQNTFQSGKDAQVQFLPQRENPFVYKREKPGEECDKVQLKKDIHASLASDFSAVTVRMRKIAPCVTERELRKNTQLLSEFSTRFDRGVESRAHNIALAAAKLSGTVLQSGEEFSFNRTVGARTPENGFRKAKVIFQGEFTEDYGGGVCQVSSTLYNCALLAGAKITAQRAHSLAVGYVEPSFDAMVSAYNDFKFQNPYAEPLYLQCLVQGGKITARLYGRSTGCVYERKSIVCERIAPPQAEVRPGKAEQVIRYPKEGIVSEGYLNVYKNGVLIRSARIRKDKYAAVRGIYETALPPNEKTLTYGHKYAILTA